MTLREAVHAVRRLSLADTATLAKTGTDPLLVTVASWRRMQPLQWHALLDAMDFPDAKAVA